MLPFLDAKKATTTIMERNAAGEDNNPDPMHDCASNLMDALKAGDKSAVAEALKAAHMHLQSSNASQEE